MPELPEVETVRRSLRPLLVGARVEGVRVYDGRLRYSVDERTLRRLVVGRRIEDVDRRAKYLVIHVEGDSRLLVHLGMSGRLVVAPREAPRETHVHVVFQLEGDRELRFRDPRRFGLVDAVPARQMENDRRLATLGVEPLSRAFSVAMIYERTRGLRKPVKNFLMDARQVVGVGNIYASEALFLAGIHPRRAAGRISRERWSRLVHCVKKVLRAAIKQGGTTINDFHNGTGDAGFFQVHLRVYDRENEACVECAAPVRRLVLAGRSTFYCPRCQR